MPFTFTPLDIPGVVRIDPRVFGDDRGFFLETYKQSAFAEAGISETFVQYNHSHSGRNVLRGLHYQKPPMAQAKLLMVLSGEIFDVAVDIRQGSPTYGQWVGEVLSAANHRMFYVPRGFAHGFCVLSDVVDLLYYVTAEYSPDHESGILWNDPDIGIAWPIDAPVLSTRDARQPKLRDVECRFTYQPA